MRAKINVVKPKVCPECGSVNCEEATRLVTKEKAHLYPEGTKKVITWV